MKQHTRQGGWLAAEALLAVVISSVLVAGAVGMFASSERSMYKERVSIAVVELGGNSRKAFSSRSDYTGVSESAVQDLGLLPGVLKKGGPDGADLSVSPGPAVTFDFVFDFAGTASAREWCADMLPDPDGVWISTGAGGAAGEGLQSGMTLEDAVDACDGSTVFTFRGM